jgi:glycerol-3-phosphate acyltransferase PlsY
VIVLDLPWAAVMLVAGYLAGSLPVSTWIGRAAGVDAAHERPTRSGARTVWERAGPGWGLLALTGDLTKGVLPVAVGIVTFTWWTGWVAGAGVLAGVGWPLVGRRPGETAVAALAGAAIALAPVAGVVGALLALPVAALARAVGRQVIIAAVASWLLAFPVLFLLEHRDPARLGGLAILYLLAGARSAVARR